LTGKAWLNLLYPRLPPRLVVPASGVHEVTPVSAFNASRKSPLVPVFAWGQVDCLKDCPCLQFRLQSWQDVRPISAASIPSVEFFNRQHQHPRLQADFCPFCRVHPFPFRCGELRFTRL